MLPAKLASAAGSIVDHQVFPADELLANNKLVGSGPYKIDSIDRMPATAKAPARSASPANSEYRGDEQAAERTFALRYFSHAGRAQDRPRQGRGRPRGQQHGAAAAARIKDDQIAGKGDLKVAEGDSAETRFLVFNTKDPVGRQPRRPPGRRAAARPQGAAPATSTQHRAAAVLGRARPASPAHNTAFFDRYGEPNVSAAKQILAKAGIQTPVQASPSPGPVPRPAASRARRSRRSWRPEASSRWTVKAEPSWDTFKTTWKTGAYQAYTRRLDPRLRRTRRTSSSRWSSAAGPTTTAGTTGHQQATGPAEPQGDGPYSRAGVFGRIQDTVAEGAPLIPLWQSKSTTPRRNDISGVESTVDTTGVFRFWEIGRIDNRLTAGPPRPARRQAEAPVRPATASYARAGPHQAALVGVHRGLHPVAQRPAWSARARRGS